MGLKTQVEPLGHLDNRQKQGGLEGRAGSPLEPLQEQGPWGKLSFCRIHC